MKKKTVTLLGIAIVLAVNLCIGYSVYSEEAKERGGDEEVLQQIETLIRTLQVIRRNYVDIDKVKTEDLFNGAMQGMARVLDPYSVYLPPKQLQNFMEENGGVFGGIGITSQVQKDKSILILNVLKNSPCEKAGLKAGDVIVKVDGKELASEKHVDPVALFRGKVDTKVKLSVKRPSENAKVYDFELTRAVIETPNVINGRILEGTDIGYVRILQFVEPTAKSLEAVLRDFTEKKAQALILDLRGNPGGLLDSAIAVCSFFLPKGKKVVTIRYHSDTKENRESERFEEHNTRGGFKLPDSMKVIVLIDGNSASASEIVSGCLRDHRRAVLLGTKSFGKGSVQNVIDLGGGKAIKLTIARYYTPDPERPTIDKNGIMPDITQEMTPAEFNEAVSSIDGQGPYPEKDKQLARAIEILDSLSVLSRK